MLLLSWYGLFMSVMASFSPKIANSRRKKPHRFDLTSTLCHLYSVTLFSKEIKHLRVFFSPHCSAQKGKANVSLWLRSELSSHELALNFFHLSLDFHEKDTVSHHLPIELEPWKWGKSLQVTWRARKRLEPQHSRQEETKTSQMVCIKHSRKTHSSIWKDWAKHVPNSSPT